MQAVEAGSIVPAQCCEAHCEGSRHTLAWKSALWETLTTMYTDIIHLSLSCQWSHSTSPAQTDHAVHPASNPPHHKFQQAHVCYATSRQQESHPTAPGSCHPAGQVPAVLLSNLDAVTNVTAVHHARCQTHWAPGRTSALNINQVIALPSTAGLHFNRVTPAATGLYTTYNHKAAAVVALEPLSRSTLQQHSCHYCCKSRTTTRTPLALHSAQPSMHHTHITPCC